MLAAVQRATIGVIATALAVGVIPAGDALGYSLGRVTEFPVAAGSEPLEIGGPGGGVVWFTEYQANRIGRSTTDGVVTEYFIYVSDSRPLGIAAGPGSTVWFTLYGGNRIGRVGPGGKISLARLPTKDAFPQGITLGPDGAIWFTEAHQLGRIDPSTRAITEYPIAGNSWIQDITVGADGALWFADTIGHAIGKYDPLTGSSALYPVGTLYPLHLAATLDGGIWFTTTNVQDSYVYRFDPPTSTVTAMRFTKGVTYEGNIAVGPDANLWFAAETLGRVYQMSPAGAVLNSFQTAGQPLGVGSIGDGYIWFTDVEQSAIGRITIP